MKGIFFVDRQEKAGLHRLLLGRPEKSSGLGTEMRSHRSQALLLKAAIIAVLVVSVIGCSGPVGSSSLSQLYGKEVLVTMEPTVIATSTTSEVRENKMNGRLVSADDNWVVLNTSPETVALSRDKVTTIAEVQARP